MSSTGSSTPPGTATSTAATSPTSSVNTNDHSLASKDDILTLASQTFLAVRPSLHPVDRLTILPPELLLQVLTHLPTSSCLLALSQTSIYFQTLILTTHASTICNNLITAHHSAASCILNSTYSSTGWLLPTHPCVVITERRMIRDKILASGCNCRTCSEFVRSSASSASSSEISLADMNAGKSLFNCFPSPPSSPSTCKASQVLDNSWRLTMSGPMYLVFLERYEWEIETRHAMKLAALTPDPDAEGGNVVDESRKEQEEKRFEFIVGNYSVRRFLEDVEREFSPSPPTDTVTEQPVSRTLMERSRNFFQAGKKLLTCGKTPPKKTEKSETRRMMFGEITEKDVQPAKARTSWMKGLVWYYGINNAVPSPDSAGKHAAKGEGGRRLGDGRKMRMRGCISGVKQGARKMKQVFRHKLLLGFHNLEG